MSNLPEKLKTLNPKLHGDFEITMDVVSKLLHQYIRNFPTYTDHSIEHTLEVLNIAGEVLTRNEIDNLNSDELYILCMACILHDVGMCIPEAKIKEISKTEEIQQYRKDNPEFETEKYIRDIHHILSYKFIVEEWQTLKIPSKKYAEAIGLVAQGHRKVDLNDFEQYNPQFFVKNGREFVCLPFLSCVIRIADELDISNLRTPEILFKYYIPDNEVSRQEWEKHKSTAQVNFKQDTVIVEAKCSDHNMLGALEEQFEKIKTVISQCQKTIRSLHIIADRRFNLELNNLEVKYDFIDFDPKGIKYSFEVKNVINAFVGEDLYENYDAALREVVQNAVDACMYKQSIVGKEYKPHIEILVNDCYISFEDNGQGMDEFIIENYFGKLASSFYQQEAIKSDFQAIGQFGIGVFSYFLISDYIDVETKRAEKTGLKFRTDRDPNVYFHFFEDFKKDDEGTKITLHLKQKYHSSFSLEQVRNFVEKSFPFITIPITIKNSEEEITVMPGEISVSFEENVLPHFYYNKREKSKNYKILTHYEKNQNLEGIVGIMVPKNIKKTPDDLMFLIDGSSIEKKGNYISDHSLITIAQKGVYINDYEGRVDYIFGKVNLQKKLKINLNRTDFVNDDSVSQILESFERNLIQLLFNHIFEKVEMESKEHSSYSDWFISNYWGRWGYSKQMKELLKKLLCFEFYINGVVKHSVLETIDREFDEFVMFNDKKDAKKYSKNLKLPYTILDMSLGRSYSKQSFFSSYIKYGSALKKIDGRIFPSYIKSVYSKQKEASTLLKEYDIYFNLSDFEDKRIAIDSMEGHPLNESNAFHYPNQCRINSKHQLTTMIIDLAKAKKLTSVQIRMIKEIFSLISSFTMRRKKSEKDLKTALSNINTIINKLSLELSHKIKLLDKTDLMTERATF